MKSPAVFDTSINSAPAPAVGTKGLGGDIDGDEKEGHFTKTTADAAGEQRRNTSVPKCSYRDFSRVPVYGNGQATSSLSGSTSTNKQHKFPAKLHLVLSDPTFEDVVAWMPHGRSWKILKPQVFEEELLPHLFGHCHLNSFMRQVNGWGFRRIKNGKDYNSYYHELFLRGKPHLIDQMRRESVRSKDRRSKHGSAGVVVVPDLYKISEENPLPENSHRLDRPANNTTVAIASACSGYGNSEGVPGHNPQVDAALNAWCYRQREEIPNSSLAQGITAMPRYSVTPTLDMLECQSEIPYQTSTLYHNFDFFVNRHLSRRLQHAPSHTAAENNSAMELQLMGLLTQVRHQEHLLLSKISAAYATVSPQLDPSSRLNAQSHIPWNQHSGSHRERMEGVPNSVTPMATTLSDETRCNEKQKSHYD